MTSLLKISALAGAASFLYALSDEWHQSFVPTRQASIADLISDAVGIILALFLIYYLLPSLKTSQND